MDILNFDFVDKTLCFLADSESESSIESEIVTISNELLAKALKRTKEQKLNNRWTRGWKFREPLRSVPVGLADWMSLAT